MALTLDIILNSAGNYQMQIGADVVNAIKKTITDAIEEGSAAANSGKAKGSSSSKKDKDPGAIAFDEFLKLSKSQRAGIVAGQLARLGDRAVDTADTLAGLGDNLQRIPGFLKNIPLLGSILEAVIGNSVTVAEQFNSISTTGVTFNNSVHTMIKSAATAGMSLQDFASLISSNGDSLRFLGGTTEAGARIFSQLSKEVRNSGRELYALGFSTRDVNEGIMSYVKLLGLQGLSENRSTNDLIAGSKRYLKELDILAKATGETRKEKEQERLQLVQDAQFQAAMAGLDASTRDSFTNAVQGMASGLRNFGKDIMAVGVATTEENQTLMALLPQSAAMLTDFHMKLQRGESVTLEERNRLNNLLAIEGKQNLEAIKQAAAASPELYAVVNGIVSAIQVHEDALKNATAEQRKAIEEQNKFNESVNKGRENVAALSSLFLSLMANEQILEGLKEAIRGVVDILGHVVPFINDYIMPAFGFLVENIWAVVLGLIAIKSGLLLLNMSAIIKASSTTSTMLIGLGAKAASAGRLLALIGGPLGILLGFILPAVMSGMAKSSDKVADAADKQAKEMEELQKASKKASASLNDLSKTKNNGNVIQVLNQIVGNKEFGNNKEIDFMKELSRREREKERLAQEIAQTRKEIKDKETQQAAAGIRLGGFNELEEKLERREALYNQAVNNLERTIEALPVEIANAMKAASFTVTVTGDANGM